MYIVSSGKGLRHLPTVPPAQHIFEIGSHSSGEPYARVYIVSTLCLGGNTVLPGMLPCRTMLLQLEEERKKLLEAISATFAHLGSGASDLLEDKAKLGSMVAGLTLLALGVYSTREGVRVAGSTFERWFGTPRLVRVLTQPCHYPPPPLLPPRQPPISLRGTRCSIILFQRAWENCAVYVSIA